MLWASAVRPETAHPMCASISMILSMLLGSISGLVMRFSTAMTMPCAVLMAIAVDPSLIASIAYSTWNSRPSGLNVFTPRSYSLRVMNMARVCSRRRRRQARRARASRETRLP